MSSGAGADTPKSFYIELFDDELWDANQPKAPGPGEDPEDFERAEKERAIRRAQLLETTRLKCLLCLALGYRINVPEQWAISSPLFTRVGADIIRGWEGYKTAVKDAPNAGWPPEPISIWYFADDVSSHLRFQRAMTKRLAPKRRLKLAPAFDTDLNEGKALENREAFVGLLADGLIGTEAGVSRLARLVGDSQDGKAFAQDITTIAKYEHDTAVSDVFAGADYNAQLAVEMQNVSDLFKQLRRESSDLDPAWVGLVHEVDRFFALPEIASNVGHIMNVWSIAKDKYGEDSDELKVIETFGRGTMHKSLATHVRANVQSETYTAFKGVGDVDFYLNASEKLELSNSGERPLFDEEIFVEERAHEEDFWKTAWVTVHKVRSERAWIDYVDGLKARVRAAGGSLQAVNDALGDLIPKLNGRLETARFQVIETGGADKTLKAMLWSAAFFSGLGSLGSAGKIALDLETKGLPQHMTQDQLLGLGLDVTNMVGGLLGTGLTLAAASLIDTRKLRLSHRNYNRYSLGVIRNLRRQ